MRLARYVFVMTLLVLTSAVLAQTTSPRCSTTVFDLQTGLGAIALDSGLQYVSGTGVRLISSAMTGTASFVGVSAPFLTNNAVPSWNLDLPSGTGARMEIRAVNYSTSTIWYEVGRIGTIPGGIKRHTSDTYGYIDIDTLMLSTVWPQIEYRVILYSNAAGVTPTLRLMSLCYADTSTPISYVALPAPGVTTSLPVPWRSQYWVPDIGSVICGPTSLTMAEDYFGCNLPTETVAADAYDSYNKLYGNWPFLAQAAAKRGFKAYVLRANTQQPLRDLIAAGNVAIMSTAYDPGELTNSPISSTAGHLILSVGIASNGDYICNDPAGSDSRWDHVTYYASQMAHVWLYHGGGVLIAVMPNLVYGRYPYYTYQSSAPIVTDTRGRMYLVARAINGTVFQTSQTTANGAWNTIWGSTGGVAASDPVTVTNRNKGLSVFARFPDGNLYCRQSVAGGSWSSWTSLGGPIVGKPAVGKSPDGRLDVFCRMPDGSIQHRWEASSSGWQDWASLGGSMAGDPVVALTWEGRQEIYARGTDNQLYWKYQLNDGSWSAWASLGGPIAGQPATGRASDGRTEVYCRFADGTLQYKVQSSTSVGTTWGGWTAISSPAGSDPVLARPASGLQEMFITDSTGQVMRNQQTAIDGAWGSWTSLGGSALGGGAPIVGHHDNGLLQVFIIQADGRMWGRSQVSGGTWGDWTAVSQALFVDVTPPVIGSVTVTPSLAAKGDPVQVQVSASDNVGVQSVTANGIPLTDNGGGNWSGAVQAASTLGWHAVTVETRDAANNTATDASHGYTTASVCFISNRSAFEEIMADVQSRYLFSTFGQVTVQNSGAFTVDDGSQAPVTVYAPNHGLSGGEYVIVHGMLNRVSPTEASLTTSAGLIQTVTVE